MGLLIFAFFFGFYGTWKLRRGPFFAIFYDICQKWPSSQLPGPTTFNCNAFSTYRDKYIVHYLCDENWTDMMKCLNETDFERCKLYIDKCSKLKNQFRILRTQVSK